MSRIFDALQRSKAEGAEFDFPLSLAAALTEEAEMPAAMGAEADAESENGAFPRIDLGQFQSLTIAPSADSHLVSLTDQASLGAEKFRFLGVRLRQLRQARSLKKLLITSTVPEEGKTMICANLAISLAQRRSQKVLLLEGDLRRPTLSTRFGFPDLPGLSESLQGGGDPVPRLCYFEQAGLWFMPAGRPPNNPLDLMQSPRLAEIMDQLTEWFDWILIDSPPIAPLADASVWMRLADGILMVVREGKTQKRQLRRGLQKLDQAKMLGVVLNGSNNVDRDNYYQRYGPLTVK